MKIKLTNVRIAFIDLFEAGQKYGKYGAQFRFSKDTGYKELIESTIDNQGRETFGAKWDGVKKALYGNGKILKVYDGADKGYGEEYYISVHSIARPDVRGRAAEPIGASDRILYPGCHVDVIFDISAFLNKKNDSVVSSRLLGVQFRGDGEPFTASPKADISDFEVITAGADAEDL